MNEKEEELSKRIRSSWNLRLGEISPLLAILSGIEGEVSDSDITEALDNLREEE